MFKSQKQLTFIGSERALSIFTGCSASSQAVSVRLFNPNWAAIGQIPFLRARNSKKSTITLLYFPSKGSINIYKGHDVSCHIVFEGLLNTGEERWIVNGSIWAKSWPINSEKLATTHSY